MNRIPRGNAIIINVNEVVGRGPRKGTDIDRDNMKNLLTQLDFDVQVYNDIDGLSARVSSGNVASVAIIGRKKLNMVVL